MLHFKKISEFIRFLFDNISPILIFIINPSLILNLQIMSTFLRLKIKEFNVR